MTNKIIFFFCFFFFVSCTEGALYDTLNPPLDGVVIEGNPHDNVSGFLVGEALDSICKKDEGCFFTLSNRNFGTYSAPLAREFLLQPDAEYGIRVTYKNTFGLDTDTVYLYRRNGQTLERNNYNYTKGIVAITKPAEYNLTYLRDEEYKNILERGVIGFNRTALHAKDYFYIFLQLQHTLNIGDEVKVCSGLVDKEKAKIGNEIDKVLINPNCIKVLVPTKSS